MNKKQKTLLISSFFAILLAVQLMLVLPAYASTIYSLTFDEDDAYIFESGTFNINVAVDFILEFEFDNVTGWDSDSWMYLNIYPDGNGDDYLIVSITETYINVQYGNDTDGIDDVTFPYEAGTYEIIDLVFLSDWDGGNSTFPNRLCLFIDGDFCGGASSLPDWFDNDLDTFALTYDGYDYGEGDELEGTTTFSIFNTAHDSQISDGVTPQDAEDAIDDVLDLFLGDGGIGIPLLIILLCGGIGFYTMKGFGFLTGLNVGVLLCVLFLSFPQWTMLVMIILDALLFFGAKRL